MWTCVMNEVLNAIWYATNVLCEKYDDSGHQNEMSNSALCSVKYMKSMYVKYMDMNLMMLCQACEFWWCIMIAYDTWGLKGT